MPYNKKKENYISTRGYSIIKENSSQTELNDIRRDLTVKPFVNKQFSAIANPFSVFLESKKKLYVPRYYGIEKFGLPSTNKLKGSSINIKFNSKSFGRFLIISAN